MEKQKMAIMAIGFILIAALSFFLTKEKEIPIETHSTTDISKNLPQTIKDNKNKTSNEIHHEMKTDLSLGEIDLGITIDDMRHVLGKEVSQKTEGDYQFFNYNSIQVGVKNGIVNALVSNNLSAKTKRGLHQGSNLQEVIDTYGKNYLKSQYENLILYEYKFTDTKNREGIVRFAINNTTNIVEYISVRIPDEKINTNSSKQTKSSNESIDNPAQLALKNYYKYITERKFQEAYNTLTWDMQNQMGTYENFSKGYDETISSTVQNIKNVSINDTEAVLQYDLIAQDKFEKNRIKVQNFRGIATLKLENGIWHINGMKVKKTGEHTE